MIDSTKRLVLGSVRRLGARNDVQVQGLLFQNGGVRVLLSPRSMDKGNGKWSRFPGLAFRVDEIPALIALLSRAGDWGLSESRARAPERRAARSANKIHPATNGGSKK